MLVGAISNFDERLSELQVSSEKKISYNVHSALAIATGKILASLDLAKYFDFVLASSEVKTAKPEPRYSLIA